MIYKLRTRSYPVLSLLALLSILALLAVENWKVISKKPWYEEKLAAAILANRAFEILRNHRMQEGVFVDSINDPNHTTLIGQEFTLITTDRGNLNAKLTATNPNFAAVIIDLLKRAGVKENDHIAVAFTGSFPGLNIAVLSALETLGVTPLIITSVGASNWGANDPYFTWLDMERILYKKGVFKNTSVAASIGGGRDRGKGLSPEGRLLIRKAIKRNRISLIEEDYLIHSIEKRLSIYNRLRGDAPLKLYINVGGGIASLGSSVNGRTIHSGLTKRLPVENFPIRGVMIKIAQQGVPIIHLLNIEELASRYGLQINPVPLPKPGSGKIYADLKYNLPLVTSLVLFLGVLITLFFIIEKKQQQPENGANTPKNHKDQQNTKSSGGETI